MAAVIRKAGDEQSGKKSRRPPATPESLWRGERLAQWLEQRGFDQAEFAREMGISKMSLSLYVRGQVDLANMQQANVEKLLTAMHVSDKWAWEYFQIPEERRDTWRTFRGPPMGANTELPSTAMSMVLDAPLSGEGYAAPVGAIVIFDTAALLEGAQLVCLSGRYVVALPDAIPGQGKVMGQFLGTSHVAPVAKS